MEAARPWILVGWRLAVDPVSRTWEEIERGTFELPPWSSPETNDASVSMVNVGGSAVDVSSRTFSTLSRKKSDSDSAEMPSDAGGWLAWSFCWRLLRRDQSFLGFPAFEAIFSFQYLSSFRSSKSRLRSSCRTQAIQSIAEWVRLYRLSNILTFRLAALQSLSNHGVSGRSRTETSSTGRCSSMMRRRVPSYRSKRAEGDIVESESVPPHSWEPSNDFRNESLSRCFQNRTFLVLWCTAKFIGGNAQRTRLWSE